MSGLSRDELIRILACPDPACRASLVDESTSGLSCPACGRRFGASAHTIDLTPADWADRTPHAETWTHLQRNGLASYTHDPEHNLGVGDRADYLAFGRFCALSGLVLDVGCGPQPWPTHFREHAEGTRFVGIDPLVADRPAPYTMLQAHGEQLPFRGDVFDRVIFATSLDHMIDVGAALAEAARVCRDDGHILIWSGEKQPDAPRPATSPAWYRQLDVPAGAADPFHLERWSETQLLEFYDQAGLHVIGHEATAVDQWRTNHFYRLAAAPTPITCERRS